MSVKNLWSNLIVTGLLTAGLTLGMPSYSAVIFQDNFDNDASSTQGNFNTLLNWEVSDGTIDYLRDNDPIHLLRCYDNTGGCLDMDGSTFNAGRITSKTSFNFLANVWYTIEFQISGNQRNNTLSDSIKFGFVDGTTAIAFVERSSIVSTEPFQSSFIAISRSTPWSANLFFEGGDGDNVGVILDNVILRDSLPSPVPEPASLALLGIGLAGLGFMRRRRT